MECSKTGQFVPSIVIRTNQQVPSPNGRIHDLKIYEPVYKCYREKGNCQVVTSYQISFI